MTPEQLAKMQAGRKASLEARKAEQARLDNDDHAAWMERHQRALADTARGWAQDLRAQNAQGGT